MPDLSTSVPSPTDGGKTYTFELRSGIRYSNGEGVTPADFRRAIERVSLSMRTLTRSSAGSSEGKPA